MGEARNQVYPFLSAWWRRQPPAPPSPKTGGSARASWRQKPAPDDVRCQATTAKGTNAGKQCYNPASMQFGGKRYCERHHPIRHAECAAWRIHRKIAELEAMGFSVRPAATKGDGR